MQITSVAKARQFCQQASATCTILETMLASETNSPPQMCSGIDHQLGTLLGRQLGPDGLASTIRTSFSSACADDDWFTYISNHDSNKWSDENGVAAQK